MEIQIQQPKFDIKINKNPSPIELTDSLCRFDELFAEILAASAEELASNEDASENEMPPANEKIGIIETSKSTDPEESADSIKNDIEFDTKFRGYDREQVDDYIDAITEDYNRICAEHDYLKQENEGLRRALACLDDNYNNTGWMTA